MGTTSGVAHPQIRGSYSQPFETKLAGVSLAHPKSLEKAEADKRQ
jgi:hypothetical protein